MLRARFAVAFLLVLAFSPSARASCMSMLDDAVGAFPCLICPCFFVPAFCCATAADTPEVWELLGDSASCCGRAICPPAGEGASADEVPPLPAVARAIAY